MRIKVQTAMVLNLDKCIGCHTCSLPCKNVWTNRQGAEYIWFNNVETKPGIGYPKKWENQAIHKGGWTAKGGKLALKAGGRAYKMARIFNNPHLPSIDEYYEPWNYDYARLTDSPERKHQPAIRPQSQLTGKHMQVKWGPNWEDDLAGVCETSAGDINFDGLDRENWMKFEQVFMFWLPRLCEHCLNPGCVASCPSGALYKRDEDGIVLVDQARCRGWRYCVTGCPYKKVYFNWKRGTSEKCIFCYPRTENGRTTLCSESCVGRIRYTGILLYDADRIAWAASQEDPKRIYPAHREILLDPEHPDVRREAERQGIPRGFLEAARRSPVYKLIKWRLALPLHPEFRTLPMVWYVPPLSPVNATVPEGAAPDEVIDAMRIPVRYLANLLTAGDEEPVRFALTRLMAIRRYMRSMEVDQRPDDAFLAPAGLSGREVEEMYKLLAIAKYEDRFVLPTARTPESGIMPRIQGEMGFE